MKALRKRPGAPWEPIEIENTLQALQEQVGGYIESITIARDFALLVNEEGRINGMHYNTTICGLQLFGVILAVGVKGDEFSDVPISAEAANMILKR